MLPPPVCSQHDIVASSKLDDASEDGDPAVTSASHDSGATYDLSLEYNLHIPALNMT